ASREDLDDLYRTPLFFKAVAVDGGDEVLAALRQGDHQRQIDALKHREAAAKKRAAANGDAAAGNGKPRAPAHDPSSKPGSTVDGDDQRSWLLWARDLVEARPDESPDAVAARQQPRMLASFSNGTPFLVERRIGQGRVLFISSGVHSSWNNLTR